MVTDIEVWEIDRKSRSGTKLGVAEQLETEEMLEDVLVANPAMLMSGITLVGRQVPVRTGYADLLGIDENGRLVVFELKRGKLTRDAVAQVLDYCSYLEELPDSELTTLIAKSTGTGGINKIEDFEDWYGSRGGDSIKPVRMKLVGLGSDVAASRMVEFLAGRGIDISLIIYHGYNRRNGTLLARQIQYAEAPRKSSGSREDQIKQKSKEYGVEVLWRDARESLDYSDRTYYTSSGITYQQRPITLPVNVRVRGSHSVTIDGHGTLRITFYPAAIDLCLDKFEKLKETIKFKSEKPPNAPWTQRAPKQWYCRLDENSWQSGKALIIEFVRTVENTWRQYEYSATVNSEEVNEP